MRLRARLSTRLLLSCALPRRCRFVSRSKFEKEGGSTTAKWHCSIKVRCGLGADVSVCVWHPRGRQLPV